MVFFIIKPQGQLLIQVVMGIVLLTYFIIIIQSHWMDFQINFIIKSIEEVQSQINQNYQKD